jgi:hypothetical protein
MHDLEQEWAKNLNENRAQLIRKVHQNWYGISFTFLFERRNKELVKTTRVRHKIDTGDSRPIKQSVRRASLHLSEEIDRNINEMLEHGITEPSLSVWASPINLVKKKDNIYRFCVDYRSINTCRAKAYPLPKIDQSLDQQSVYSFFSTLDMFRDIGRWNLIQRTSIRQHLLIFDICFSLRLYHLDSAMHEQRLRD